MDCGDFVKIGVSGNVEQRATQIPYKVNQIYSTDEMEDAFKLEQTEPNTVDKYHYELVFYPERIIPDIEIK